MGLFDKKQLDYLEEERQKLWERLTHNEKHTKELEKQIQKKTTDFEKEAAQASKKTAEFRNKAASGGSGSFIETNRGGISNCKNT